MASDARPVEEYLSSLPLDRAQTLRAVRQVVLENLPAGYQECLSFGMISYVVPLERYPRTYNGQPLLYAALAAKKNYLTVHLMAVYGEDEAEFRAEYAKSGKRLDMGKSCVRFKTLDELALAPVVAAVGRFSVEDFIGRYEAARQRPERG